MGRRVFLSMLGTGFYEKCRYQKDDFLGTETTFVQKNLVEYLQWKEGWRHDDEVIMLLTDAAKKNNWNKDIASRFNSKLHENMPYVGLEKIFVDMGVSYKTVGIDDGKDEKQMWRLFGVIFNQLEEDDQLYLDITNSFRYLPMLLVVLVNYAKFLKNVKVKAIYYGNYEARDTETNIAPIMDLLPLSSLQDWTSAASDYLQYGQVDKLHFLSNQELDPILRNSVTRTEDTKYLYKFVNALKKIVDERITCRGLDIIESRNVKSLEKNAQKIQEVAIPQLGPVFEKIIESLEDFGTVGNVYNCLKAAKWCFENKLYQQAITLLEEGLVTVLCDSYHLDYTQKKDRRLISNCIHIASQKTPEDKWEVNEEDKKTILEILKNEKYLASLTGVIELRNDYNHAGFNKDHKSANKVIERIESLIGTIENVLKSTN